MNPIYRPVPGYADLYAGMDGTIVCGWRGTLEPKVHKRSKYLYVCVPRIKGVRRGGYKNVHVLVAEAFYGPRPKDIQIRHGDHDRTNAAIDNLCYGTAKDNQRDSIAAHGTHVSLARAAKTECSHGHKYTPQNTHIRSTGDRSCRKCNTLAQRNRRKRVDAGHIVGGP